MKGILNMVLMVVVWGSMGSYAHAQSATHPSDTAKKVMQQAVRPAKPKGPKPIKHEFSLGYRLNTDGWSGYMNLATVKSPNPKTADMFYSQRLWQFEFTEKKSPKQEKTTVDDGSGNSGSYILGKINNFYAFKLGYGFSKMLAGKPDPGSVSIHWLNVIGFSLGMLKPYYLNVDGDPNAIKYSEDTKADFFNQHIIEGNAGFSKGLGEMKFIPGGHLKSALHFDFSANRKDVLGGEVGINAEFYSANVPIMINQKDNAYFVDIYIAIELGKRW